MLLPTVVLTSNSLAVADVFHISDLLSGFKASYNDGQ